MVKEKLVERIKYLNDSLAKLQADFNSVLGAKQDCEYWLAQLEDKELVEQQKDMDSESV